MEKSDQDLCLGSNQVTAVETKMDSSQESGKKHSQSSRENQIEEDLPSQPQAPPLSTTEVSPQDVTRPLTGLVTRPLHRFGRTSASPICKQEPRGQTEVVTRSLESNDKQKHCKCKTSTCLKLYCVCFVSGSYCNGCNCLNCHNNLENETSRVEAITAILKRNPAAFNPKINGCKCKKSGCLKYLCECYKADVICSENCRCQDCKNFQGSQERRKLRCSFSFMNARRKRKEAARDSSAVLPHVIQNQAVIKNSSSDVIKKEQTSKKHKPEPEDEEQSHGDSSLG